MVARSHRSRSVGLEAFLFFWVGWAPEPRGTIDRGRTKDSRLRRPPGRTSLPTQMIRALMTTVDRRRLVSIDYFLSDYS